jgi:hypothetical protein
MELDLGLGGPGPSGPLEIAFLRMGHLRDAPCRAYHALGFPQATGHRTLNPHIQGLHAAGRVKTTLILNQIAQAYVVQGEGKASIRRESHLRCGGWSTPPSKAKMHVNVLQVPWLGKKTTRGRPTTDPWHTVTSVAYKCNPLATTSWNRAASA